jgi:cytoplasmic iron level regulating protein YaaA (DUF328/UPF0246 family)
MLAVISPAKRLDWTPEDRATSDPEFQDQANILAGHARQLTLGKLKSLMDLSDDLARLNRDRFRAFDDAPTGDAQKAAVLAFAGDTYLGLDAKTLDPKAMAWGQDHLRILSGLYGVLRPMDAIQPYRLEMGSRLKSRRGQTLYAFWGDRISKALNRDAEAAGAEVLVNCASQEYFGAVDLKALKLRVITPLFLEDRAGKVKTVSFFAKRARGAMARYIVENRLTNADDLKGFDTDGYRFDAARSEGDTWAFIRDYPEPASSKVGS